MKNIFELINVSESLCKESDLLKNAEALLGYNCPRLNCEYELFEGVRIYNIEKMNKVKVCTSAVQYASIEKLFNFILQNRNKKLTGFTVPIEILRFLKQFNVSLVDHYEKGELVYTEIVSNDLCWPVKSDPNHTYKIDTVVTYFLEALNGTINKL